LITRKNKPEPKGIWNDCYEYSSDDSFIDDGEYDEFVEEVQKDELVEEDEFFVSDKNATEEIIKIVEEEVSSDDEPQVRKNRLLADINPDEDLSLVPEMEAAIKQLQNRINELGYNDNSKKGKTIPPEFNEELGNIANIRVKFYPKGIPLKLVKRLMLIPAMAFSEKTIKDRLKFCLKNHERDNVIHEIDELKNKLQEAINEDLRASISKKRKDKKNSTKLLSDEEYKAMPHEKLLAAYNDTEFRYYWGKQTIICFTELYKKKEQWVQNTNEMKKDNEEKLDLNKEMKNLMNDLQNIFPKMSMTLMTKYKTMKKDEENGTTSTAGGTPEKKKEEEKKEEKKPEEVKKRKYIKKGDKEKTDVPQTTAPTAPVQPTTTGATPPPVATSPNPAPKRKRIRKDSESKEKEDKPKDDDEKEKDVKVIERKRRKITRDADDKPQQPSPYVHIIAPPQPMMFPIQPSTTMNQLAKMIAQQPNNAIMPSPPQPVTFTNNFPARPPQTPPRSTLPPPTSSMMTSPNRPQQFLMYTPQTQPTQQPPKK
jgi:hypothetical protein